MCKQTFTGHESDINAITVSVILSSVKSFSVCWFSFIFIFNFVVFPQWARFCDRLRRCHVSVVRHPRRPRDRHVLPRQHHLWYHFSCLLQERTTHAWRLRRLQLQCLGHPEAGASRCVLPSLFLLFSPHFCERSRVCRCLSCCSVRQQT